MKRFALVLAFVIAAGITLSSCSSGGGDNTNGNAQFTGTVQIQGVSNQNANGEGQ